MTRPRRDVARNRTLLLEAARHVFARDGASAPLDLIVREAGVGRGTLYRHFPDREHLISALLDERISTIELRAASLPIEGRLERIILDFHAYQLDTPGLLSALRSSPSGRQHFDAMSDRVLTLFSDLVENAHRLGEIHPDVAARDIVLLVAMLESVSTNDSGLSTPAEAERAVQLLLRAIRS